MFGSPNLRLVKPRIKIKNQRIKSKIKNQRSKMKIKIQKLILNPKSQI